MFKTYGSRFKTDTSDKCKRKYHTWAGAEAAVTRSEFFSHIVNTDGGGGVGKTFNEDIMA